MRLCFGALLLVAHIGVFSPCSAQPSVTFAEDMAEERRDAGHVLLTWGLSSSAAGVTLALADAADGHLSERGLAAGVTTTSFGLINALLSLSLVGSEAVSDPGDWYKHASAEQHSGQIFALNLGLDVAYILSGVLMGLGGSELDVDWLEGAGWSMTIQGGGLLLFDIWQWAASNERAAAWHGSQFN